MRLSSRTKKPTSNEKIIKQATQSNNGNSKQITVHQSVRPLLTDKMSHWATNKPSKYSNAILDSVMETAEIRSSVMLHSTNVGATTSATKQI